MAFDLPPFRVLAASAALLCAAACNSGNPDTLTGMNVDENAAMMDANAAVEANLADGNVAQANATSEAQPDDSSENAAKATDTDSAAKSRPALEVNAAQNNSTSSAELNDVQDNQVETEPDIPNSVSNE